MTLAQLDRQALLLIQRYRPKPLNLFFMIFTYSGTSKAWVTAAAFFNVLHYLGLHFIENQIGFLRALFGPLLAWFLSSLLKKHFSRKRPSSIADGLLPLIQTPGCGSFPSGHAASAFAFFFALLFISHPVALWVGLWAVLVSFSRAYLGVHYISDLFGGMAVGFLSSVLVTLVLSFF